jgi:hypothetical protein
VGVILVALVSSVLLFKERIIQQFIIVANKQLNTPVNVGKIDVSIFQHFPRLSIVLTDVYIEDSHQGNYPLFTAKHVSFMMNPLEVYQGVYNINGISISESETTLKINKDGDNNYSILKEQPDKGSAESVAIQLKDIELKHTKVTYLSIKDKYHLVFRSDDLDASINTADDIYDIATKGHLVTELIEIEGKQFLTGKTFQIESDIGYDDKQKKVRIDPSVINLFKSSFELSGHYAWKGQQSIDLALSGKDSDIQTILSLLPQSMTSDFEKYRSTGNVYFKAELKGKLGRNHDPSLTINFGFDDATIYHPDYDARIEKANMTGSFATPEISNLRKARLTLRNVTGMLNREPFIGDLEVVDFNDPYVKLNFKGKLDANAVLGFYPVKELQNVSGSLEADVSINGQIALLKNRNTAGQVDTRGMIDLNKISLEYGDQKIPIRELAGNLQFSNNDLALSNVSGRFGNSDFVLNGFFKNVITFLLFENQPIGIEADLKSDFLDVDQLFKIAYGSENKGAKSKYEFEIPDKIYLNFNCDVRRLNYKRFIGRDIKGDLLVKNKVAVSRKLALNTMGGDLILSGIVDANNNKAIDVVCSSQLKNINIDSVFHVFENFDQDFIQDKHLKGDVTADVNFEMTLNEQLRLFPATLIADIGAVIKNGELNNFEPMKKLNRYLDDEGLSHMKFSDLQNDIHIENQTIYIPQMQINSNVTSIRISGTHTFDQRINYRLVTPLRSRKLSTDQEFAKAVELDEQGQTRLFLKITGTTDDYRIQYDTEAVKKKIVSDLKREVKELKDAFKNKDSQKKKEIELQNDEYFEWSE